MAAKHAKKSSTNLSSLKFPLPLAAILCFLCFFVGSLFSGKQLSGLPDLKQPHKEAKAASGGGGGEQGWHHGGRGGASRRQLAVEATGGNGGGGRGARGWGKDFVHAPSLLEPHAHGTSGDGFFESVAFQMVSWQPRAYVFSNFAPAKICDAIVEQAKSRMAPSGLALRAGETESATRDIRTSTGTFLSSSGDATSPLGWLERKIAKVTMIPWQHGEAYNVLRYELGQHYDSHMDVFNPKEYGPQPSNRIASFLLYLTDVEEGGETMFPYEGGKNMNIGYNYKDCIGLKVKPKKGDALLFWSMLPNGTIDPTSLHGSCPVVKGEKWVATKWIRDKGPNWM